MQKKILETLNKKAFQNPPVWFMRQAGRYLPEYREVRNKAGSFLNLCYNPKLASEVTLQPMKRFDFDGSIIFSDILIVADSLGAKLEFKEKEGPVLEKIETFEDLKKLKINEKCSKIHSIYETVSEVKKGLRPDKTLIGFAGSPWTVAAYMLEGEGSKNDFKKAKMICYENPNLVKNLIEIITEITIIYLKGQIDHGVEVIQIFDSWAGILAQSEFDEYVIRPTKKIVEALKNYKKTIPIIGFPKGVGQNYLKYIKQTKVDGVSCDTNMPVEFMKELQNMVTIQGNLDPVLVSSSNEDLIRSKVNKMLHDFSDKPYIFNLGHGILPDASINNVELILGIIREKK